MDGFLNINKSKSVTSHDVVARIRQLTGIRRVGHSGTLDPLATGVLLVAVGRSTKLIRFLPTDKTYRATVHLGVETTTYDAEGDIVCQIPLPPDVTPARIRTALHQFMGQIEQQPPVYSAIKVSGKPLYKFARQGRSVAVPKRQVTIYAIRDIQVALPQVTFSVHCSAGTYIRSLAHDLGQHLGCGGYLAGLVRTQIGHFSLTDSIPMDSIANDSTQCPPPELTGVLIPPDQALAHLPRVIIPEAVVSRVKNGVSPALNDLLYLPPDISAPAIVRLDAESGQLVAVATYCETGQLTLERVL
ncbi:MAG: tRNA pseudouridine(55) synthase TruB [Gemmatimonadetes bacterium]|nr:MAG: tRNA pseudouridine(55) synthase TruB [Gemmatimonadota bacterium]